MKKQEEVALALVIKEVIWLGWLSGQLFNRRRGELGGGD